MSPAKPPSRRGNKGSGDGDNGGEYLSSPEVRSAYISGTTFRAKPVLYAVVDGDAVFEGDILLGTVEQVERDSALLAAEVRGEMASAAVISGDQFRWPNCRVPYTINPSLADQARVTDAIAHWEANTNYTFVLRTSEADFVTFQTGSGCSAHVGRRGGEQFVNLAPGCTTGATIHEIGHVVGLWHEQSREDRDAFVTINWANIQAGREHNFNQHITDGDDVGPYDYGSIMHYSRTAFSTGGGAETITPTNPSAVIGQRNGLSPGDIAAANSLCTAPKPNIETIKEISPETIKEISPETIKERFPETIKERIPETLKERIPETRKELIETIKENLEPPVTWVEKVQPGGPGRVVNPAGGGVLPFAMRTPHADPTTAGAGAAEVEALIAQFASVAEALAALEAEQGALLEQYQQLAALLAQLGLQ